MKIFSQIIGFALSYMSPLLTFLCRNIEVDPQEIVKKIVTVFSVLNVFIVLFNHIEFDYIGAMLGFLQNHFAAVCVFIFVLAVLPPGMAWLDKKNLKRKLENTILEITVYAI